LSGGQDAPRPAVIGDEAPLFDEVAEFSKGRARLSFQMRAERNGLGRGELGD
jgi:hypothetical protein